MLPSMRPSVWPTALHKLRRRAPFGGGRLLPLQGAWTPGAPCNGGLHDIPDMLLTSSPCLNNKPFLSVNNNLRRCGIWLVMTRGCLSATTVQITCHGLRTQLSQVRAWLSVFGFTVSKCSVVVTSLLPMAPAVSMLAHLTARMHLGAASGKELKNKSGRERARANTQNLRAW